MKEIRIQVESNQAKLFKSLSGKDLNNINVQEKIIDSAYRMASNFTKLKLKNPITVKFAKDGKKEDIVLDMIFLHKDTGHMVFFNTSFQLIQQLMHTLYKQNGAKDMVDDLDEREYNSSKKNPTASEKEAMEFNQLPADHHNKMLRLGIYKMLEPDPSIPTITVKR